MLYTFLITVVFIAEIIILTSVMLNLLRLDKLILVLNDTVEQAKPGIKDISELSHKISEQWLELSEDWTENFRRKKDDKLYGMLNKVLIALLLWRINSKAVKRFRHSKAGRMLLKGYRLLQSVV